MSTLSRTIWLNINEPAPLSFRAPTNMEQWLEVSIRGITDMPYPVDVAAQLHLTARSSNSTTTYAMPAIDIVNGKSRAIIPAGDITDPNGYRLSMVGTVNQQPRLLATGVVMPVMTDGLAPVPADVIDSINLTLAYNVDATVIVTIWHDTGKLNPFDLATADIAATVFDNKNGVHLADFMVTESGNTATLTMPAATVNTLPPACWWTLVASSAAGSQTLAEGTVTLTGTPTP